jgi:tetratricopeptide (TPR) repeat protein
MTVEVEATFQKNGEVLTKIFDGSTNVSIVNKEEISEIEKLCQDFRWHTSVNVSQKIGERLFDILNSSQFLVKSLEEANMRGELLHVSIRNEGLPDLPFELLYNNEFLVPSRIHLIRRISDYGCKKKLEISKDPLKVLFMACSPEGVKPVLNFEKEEEAILDVTRELPVDMDVEDTGSLEGLQTCLAQKHYDVIHITGHADIDDGPFFLMEDEFGYPAPVTPSLLWDVLRLNPPRLLFLSGCRTGEAPQHKAVNSFAHDLVLKHSSTVLGWGLPVLDPAAIIAAAGVYFELSRGKSITDAVFFTRQNLYKEWPDWSLLRLFSDGTQLDKPLVEKGQKMKVKARDIQYAYLQNSQVKVLTKGFIGRRRQLQGGLHSLKKDKDKVGVLLYGTGGLGKSCLAGKLCERLKYDLVIVNGELNAVTFVDALKKGFVRARDEKGLGILEERIDITDKILKLCSSSFQDKHYIILLDDFEKNLTIDEEPVVSADAAPVLGALLLSLPDTGKMSQIIITSRYTFPLVVREDLVKKLECIGLSSFQAADEWKKVSELTEIAYYKDEKTREELIKAGHGNPRLMEDLNLLLKIEQNLDVEALLSKVHGKQEEFIQNLILREILKRQSEEFQKVLQRSSVYGLPVLREGIELVCKDIQDWESLVDRGVQLSLIEKDTRGDITFYWVTPLLREEIFEELGDKNWCHKAAIVYYNNALSLMGGYDPLYGFELVNHALECGMDEIALEKGVILLIYLRDTLAYREARSKGEYIISNLSTPKRDDKFSLFLLALGWLNDELGDSKKAIDYYEQALSIGKEVYGERHPAVATDLSNLGGAWHTLGDSKKAVDYYEQALSIDKEVYGERHPAVATDLSNLGSAWDALGDSKKAVDYYEQALSIDKEVYGERHPAVATMLSNLGSAWHTLGDPKKAIDYYEQALSIDKEVYGERHPDVARDLSNLGSAWHTLGDSKKAIDYYEQALSIGKEVYGERHPDVATRLSNLGLAWDALGDSKKAVDYYEQALSIDKEVYGERHPAVATDLSNLGSAWDALGDSKKAVDYYEQALSIDKEVYGERHPAVATMLSNLGSAWHTLGDPKKAIDYYEQALSIDKEVYGERHPDVARDLSNLGSAWHTLGDSKKAIDYYEQALSIGKEVYGERHPDVATMLNNLGSAWHTLGDPKKAIDYYKQALSIDKEVYGERHPAVATRLNNLGGAWYALGDSKKAVDYYEQALSIGKEVYGERHPAVATTLSNLGLAWYALGDSKKAVDYYEQALSIGKEVYGERHPDVATTLSNLGLAWYALGDSKKAVDYYEQALSIGKEVYGERHPAVATMLNNLGSAWHTLGDPKKAIEHIQQAYNIFQEIYGDEHPHTKIVKEWLGILLNEKHELI